MELEAATNVQQLDFSLMALFIRATLTVKIVMVILLVSSVWSWSIIIQKFFVLSLRDQASLIQFSLLPSEV